MRPGGVKPWMVCGSVYLRMPSAPCGAGRRDGRHLRVRTRHRARRLPRGGPGGPVDSVWALLHGPAFLHLDGKLDASTPEVVAARVTAAVQALFTALARALGAGYRGCRTMRRWRTMKASRRAPMTILVHQELRVPSKEISACTVPRTSTPAIEPAT